MPSQPRTAEPLAITSSAPDSAYPSAGQVFCLVEAPDAGAANAVHREAHGLVADEIFEVSEHV